MTQRMTQHDTTGQPLRPVPDIEALRRLRYLSLRDVAALMRTTPGALRRRLDRGRGYVIKRVERDGRGNVTATEESGQKVDAIGAALLPMVVIPPGGRERLISAARFWPWYDSWEKAHEGK